MARLTESTFELQHLLELHNQVPIWGIVELVLMNGSVIEGVIISMKFANNAGSTENGFPTRYSAEVTIKTISGKIFTVDYLDLKFARNVTDRRIDDYHKAGILRIVDVGGDKK
ncbi:hypothetical protein V5F72_19360 [Xanthobacter flavus]|uniref:hypothetical protein n=1 Tax=Xanthobacter flavus TaxID=281 RepID=UPI00372C0744